MFVNNVNIVIFVLTILVEICTITVADRKVFNAAKCNTNADNALNWEPSSLTTPWIKTKRPPAKVRIGPKPSTNIPPIPVDVLFPNQDDTYAFGSIIFEVGTTLSFEDGAEWEFASEALKAGSNSIDVHFVGGQTLKQTDPACAVSCHANWLDVTADGEPSNTTSTTVPCANDVAVFPNGFHYQLEAEGVHMYGALEFGGNDDILSSIPVTQMYPGIKDFYSGPKVNSMCQKKYGRDCVCPSSCREPTDTGVMAKDLHALRQGSQRVARKWLANHVRETAATEATPFSVNVSIFGGENAFDAIDFTTCVTATMISNTINATLENDGALDSLERTYPLFTIEDVDLTHGCLNTRVPSSSPIIAPTTSSPSESPTASPTISTTTASTTPTTTAVSATLNPNATDAPTTGTDIDANVTTTLAGSTTIVTSPTVTNSDGRNATTPTTPTTPTTSRSTTTDKPCTVLAVVVGSLTADLIAIHSADDVDNQDLVGDGKKAFRGEVVLESSGMNQVDANVPANAIVVAGLASLLADCSSRAQPPTPSLAFSVAYNRTVVVSGSLPQTDLFLMINDDNRNNLGQHLSDGLRQRTRISRADIEALTTSLRVAASPTTEDETAAVRSYQQMTLGRQRRTTSIATKYLHLQLVFEVVGGLSDAEWMDALTVADALVSTFDPVFPLCFSLATDVDERCVNKTVFDVGVRLYARSYSLARIEEIMRERYIEVRGCSLFEYSVGVCDLAAVGLAAKRRLYELNRAAKQEVESWTPAPSSSLPSVAPTSAPSLPPTAAPTTGAPTAPKSVSAAGDGISWGLVGGIAAVIGILTLALLGTLYCRHKRNLTKSIHSVRIASAHANPIYATAQGFANYLDMEQNPHLVSADGSLQPTLDKTISKQTGYIYVMDDSDDEADRDDLYNTIHQKHGTFADTGIYGDNIVADDTVEEETRKQHDQEHQDQDQDQDQEGVYSMAANEKEIERTAPLHLEEEENFEEDEDGVYDNAGDDGDNGTFVYPVAVAPNSEANEGFYEGLIDADDDEC